MIRKSAEMTVENRTEMRGGKGTVSIIHCFRKDEIGANLRLCSRLVLPPGTSIGEHEHKQEDEVFIVTRGKGMIEDGGTSSEVGPGDAILTGNGASHSVANIGDEDLEMVAIIACY